MNSLIQNTCIFALLVGVVVVLLLAIGFLAAIFGAPVLDRF